MFASSPNAMQVITMFSGEGFPTRGSAKDKPNRSSATRIDVLIIVIIVEPKFIGIHPSMTPNREESSDSKVSKSSGASNKSDYAAEYGDMTARTR
jgi:hypothetical protein